MPAPADERRRGLRGALPAEQYRLLERSVLEHSPHLIPLLTADAAALTPENFGELRRAVDDERSASGLDGQEGTSRAAPFQALTEALSREHWEQR